MKTLHPTLIGAIAGDVIGSVYEWNNVKSTDFPTFTDRSTFTDDTVLTVAVADAILHGKDFAKTIWEYGRAYPGRGYGGKFKQWLASDNPQPYGSFGNGSAMRASAVGFAYQDPARILEVARQSAEPTHDHPEGIKGAQAVAMAVFLARTGSSKPDIKDYISRTFGYQLDFTLDGIRDSYTFDVTCQGSVPQAIVAFLESTDYESAVRLAISIGGDSDTMACMAGGIAAAFYKHIPDAILQEVISRLPDDYLSLLNQFDQTFSL